MFTEASFRDLVDGFQPTMLCDHTDLPSLYAYYGLPSDGYFSTSAVLESLSKGIALVLSVPDKGHTKGQVTCKLIDLKKQIVMHYFLDGMEYQPYWAVLNFISSSLSGLSESALLTDDETAWGRAVSLAKEKILLSPSTFNDSAEGLAQLYAREFAVVEAALHFRERGYQLRLDMGRIVMEEKELHRISSELDSSIETYGGRKFAEYFMEKMKPIYCAPQERYHLIRRPTSAPSTAQRQTPFGYLMNLTVKHLEYRRIEIPEQKGIFDEILETATMVAGLFDVQPYHFAENIRIPPHRLIGALSEYALFDRLFAFPQWRPSDLTGILRGLFAWVADDPKSTSLAWTIEDAATLIEGIIRLCKGKREPHFFHVSLLRREVGSMSDQTFQSLLTVFSHDAAVVNDGFLGPDFIPSRCSDFMFKPLIKLDAGEYCLMSSSGSAPAFYEAIAMALRNGCVKGVDQKIGDSLEEHVRQILVKRGIILSHGEYKVRSTENDRCAKKNYLKGDCDLAIETTDTIMLFEVKKQPFTRPSRAGDTGDLLHDLAKGFVHGHKQLARMAIVLKEHGNLVLQSDHKSYQIQSQGRAVERVFVTLDDYGAFQDRVLADDLLEFMTFVGISSEDQGLHKKLSRIRNECLELRECLMRLYAPQTRSFHRPFFNCRFVSLPQLLVILDDVTCNESFRKSLWFTRSSSFRTCDFYAEHFTNRQLKSRHDRNRRPFG